MFRTQFQVTPLQKSIGYSSFVLLTGSCFSEHIADRLASVKFKTLSNPFGILFNPVSMAAELRRHLQGKWIQPSEVFEHAGLFRSFDFHSNCAHPDKEQAIRLMNEGIRSGKIFLDKCTHLVITLGTSLVYKLNSSGRVVANNHKMPAHLFTKLQLQPEEIVSDWSELITELKTKYPQIQIIFTLSPVRHLKDGAVENALSKAILLQSVHRLRSIFPDIYYFPSYEIMIDDLRDYRFYEKDMVHPNETAIEYIWDLFKKVCMEEECFPVIKLMEQIQTAIHHRPFFPELKEHQDFRLTMLQRIDKLQKEYPYIDLSNERNYFSQ